MTRGIPGAVWLSAFAMAVGCNLVLGNEEAVLAEAEGSSTQGGSSTEGGSVEGGDPAEDGSPDGGSSTHGEAAQGGTSAQGGTAAEGGQPPADGSTSTEDAGGASDEASAGAGGARPGKSFGKGGGPAVDGVAGDGDGSEDDLAGGAGGEPGCECEPGEPFFELVTCPDESQELQVRDCNDDCTLGPVVEPPQCDEPPECDGCSCVNYCTDPDSGLTTCWWLACDEYEAFYECFYEATEICGNVDINAVELIDSVPPSS